jgi:hypothetical protein
MAAEPGIVSRVAQPYVAIRAFVTMQSLGEVMPGLHPEVRGWLRSRGVQSAGRPAGMRRASDGEQWGCRLETYYDEPGQDMNEWKTELAFKLAE